MKRRKNSSMANLLKSILDKYKRVDKFNVSYLVFNHFKHRRYKELLEDLQTALKRNDLETFYLIVNTIDKHLEKYRSLLRDLNEIKELASMSMGLQFNKED